MDPTQAIDSVSAEMKTSWWDNSRYGVNSLATNWPLYKVYETGFSDGQTFGVLAILGKLARWQLDPGAQFTPGIPGPGSDKN